jgi:hypothetical protein
MEKFNTNMSMNSNISILVFCPCDPTFIQFQSVFVRVWIFQVFKQAFIGSLNSFYKNTFWDLQFPFMIIY